MPDDNPPMTPDEALAKAKEIGESGNFEFAESDEMARYPDEKRRFLEALHAVAGIGRPWISDLSCVNDFALDEDECIAMSETLGVSVQGVDRITSVLCAMRVAGARK